VTLSEILIKKEKRKEERKREREKENLGFRYIMSPWR
jgi:hypothetical protein